MAEEMYEPMDMDDFDGGEDGPSLRQVLLRGAPYAVFDDQNGEAVPSWSAPVNANVSGVASGPEGAQLPLSFIGYADDPDVTGEGY